MKLSFSTLGCPAWSFEETLDNAKKMGFKGIEVRGIENVMRAEEIPYFWAENAENTKAMLQARGLEITGLGTSVSFHDANETEKNLEEGRKAIDVCVIMGIPRIRVFGDAIVGNKTEIFERVAKGLRVLCEYAEGKNVEILLEIHGDFNRLEVILPVVEKIKDRPEFGILWDIEHSHKTYTNKWAEFYEGIKPWVKHTHFKDCYKKDGEYAICLPGDGDVPMREVYERLNADGYPGWYSLEWEKKWHPELPNPEVAFPAYVKCMTE